MGFQVNLPNTRLSEVITRPRPCPMVLERACIILSFPAFPATRTMKLGRSNLPSGFFNYSILKLTFLDSKHSKQPLPLPRSTSYHASLTDAIHSSQVT